MTCFAFPQRPAWTRTQPEVQTVRRAESSNRSPSCWSGEREGGVTKRLTSVVDALALLTRRSPQASPRASSSLRCWRQQQGGRAGPWL